jgi:hypothetical protein
MTGLVETWQENSEKNLSAFTVRSCVSVYLSDSSQNFLNQNPRIFLAFSEHYDHIKDIIPETLLPAFSQIQMVVDFAAAIFSDR